MDALESAIKFLTSYPAWARGLALAGVLVSVLTLVFAPRTPSSSPSDASEPSAAKRRYWLSIEGVEVFGQEDAQIQVTIDVNGTTFVYPSLAGVKWAEVGPTMSSQQFQLPPGQLPLRLRFSALLRTSGKSPVELVSQRTVVVDQLPADGEYILHKRNEEGVRAAAVSAAVRYSITAMR